MLILSEQQVSVVVVAQVSPLVAVVLFFLRVVIPNRRRRSLTPLFSVKHGCVHYELEEF